MAILYTHFRFFDELFSFNNFYTSPFLLLGYQIVYFRDDSPDDYQVKTVKQLLMNNGVQEVNIIDLFDERANLRYDLNCPVPEKEHERYATVMDIGVIEHIFDTKMVFENCFNMLKVGGLYVLNTVVGGYFAHGLHTFHPDMILDVLKGNGFDIQYLKYSLKTGQELDKPRPHHDVLIWIGAVKTRSFDEFIIPQQRRYR
jgi:hypothetical protein